MRKIEDWDFNANHVQNDIYPGRFISSKTVLVAFGPPRFSMIARGVQGSSQANEKETPLTDEELTEDKFIKSVFTESTSYAPVPVGVVQDLSMDQSRQVSKIFEIGSDRSYHIPGRSFASLRINKIIYDGPSLLKFAMVYYVQRLENGLLGDVDVKKLENMTQYARTSKLAESNADVAYTGANRAGYDQFYINLSSDLFSYPLGVMLYFKNNAGQPYGATYLEDCFINQHGLGIQTGSSVIAETISLDFDRPIGINVKSGYGNVNP